MEEILIIYCALQKCTIIYIYIVTYFYHKKKWTDQSFIYMLICIHITSVLRIENISSCIHKKNKNIMNFLMLHDSFSNEFWFI